MKPSWNVYVSNTRVIYAFSDLINNCAHIKAEILENAPDKIITYKRISLLREMQEALKSIFQIIFEHSEPPKEIDVNRSEMKIWRINVELQNAYVTNDGFAEYIELTNKAQDSVAELRKLLNYAANRYQGLLKEGSGALARVEQLLCIDTKSLSISTEDLQLEANEIGVRGSIAEDNAVLLWSSFAISSKVVEHFFIMARKCLELDERYCKDMVQNGINRLEKFSLLRELLDRMKITVCDSAALPDYACIATELTALRQLIIDVQKSQSHDEGYISCMELTNECLRLRRVFKEVLLEAMAEYTHVITAVAQGAGAVKDLSSSSMVKMPIQTSISSAISSEELKLCITKLGEVPFKISSSKFFEKNLLPEEVPLLNEHLESVVGNDYAEEQEQKQEQYKM